MISRQTDIIELDICIGGCVKIADYIKNICVERYDDFFHNIIFVPVLDGALPLFSQVNQLLRNASLPVRHGDVNCGVKRLSTDYCSVCVKSYDKDGGKSRPIVLKSIDVNISEKLVVIIDDVYDTGATLKVLMSDLVRWQKRIGLKNFNDVIYVSLFQKIKGTDEVTYFTDAEYWVKLDKEYSIKCYSPILVPADKWLGGFGMDGGKICGRLADRVWLT